MVVVNSGSKGKENFRRPLALLAVLLSRAPFEPTLFLACVALDFPVRLKPSTMMWRELGLYTVPYKYGGHTVYGASVYRNRIDKIYILAVRYGIWYGRNTVQYGYGATYFECVIVQHLHNCQIW